MKPTAATIFMSIGAAVLSGNASAFAQTSQNSGVIAPPAMPNDGKMALPAPVVGDEEILGHAPQGASDQAALKEAYEEGKLTRLAELSTEIGVLRTSIQALPAERRDAAMRPLRTASGNRVVALTKLQQLYAAPVGRWLRLKPAVDRAFADLENAVVRARRLTH